MIPDRDELAARLFVALMQREGLDDIQPEDYASLFVWRARKCYEAVDAFTYVRVEEATKTSNKEREALANLRLKADE